MTLCIFPDLRHPALAFYSQDSAVCYFYKLMPDVANASDLML